ncbi:putative glucuronosyltransferase sqv-8 [Toxocara canis]|uniref:Galactosylgalactosylxylosylprotein 3-beta-glucuronosyltransferase n=1 Tax=Toxocara canis TaxID=6265 RepID=A0A0B2W2W6_TOXCA|nr:putative glucuronosyltransferase sqv-8 [Toxocara canis]
MFHRLGAMFTLVIQLHSINQFNKLSMSSTQRQFGVKASVIAFIFMLHFISVVVYAPSKAEVELSTKFCSRSFQALRPSEFRAQPLIIVITPTRKSLTRLPDMTRLAQSLMLVRRLAWVVVESGAVIADPIERLLKRSKLPFCYFTEHSNNAHLKDWRWLGRDSGLKFVIYRFAQFSNRAVVYFADADGAYDIRLFESYIRNVNTLGVWALGLAGAELVVAPRVTQIGIVDGWLSETHSDLEWPLDASGFAINLKVLLRHNKLAQSLMLVRRLAWVVVESGAVIADPIERLLKRSKLPFCYFTEHSNNAHLKDWRWLGRDSGLKFVIYRFAQFSNRAVVYFADADGAYDIRLFESYIRNVNTLGVWALGLAGAELVVAPRVTQIGIVDGWLSETHSDLEWPLDASGFAINLKVLLRHNNISLVNCESPVQQCFLLRLGLTRNDAKPFGYNIMPRDVLAWQPITSFRLKEPTKVYSTYDYVIEYDPPKQGWQSNKAYNGTTLTRQKVLKHAV